MENQEENKYSSASEPETMEASAPLAPRQVEQNQVLKLDRKRKIAVGVLFVLAFFVLIFWAKSFKSQISKPFYSGNGDEKSGENYEQEDSEVSLRAKDTDGDSLNDWDELNSYNTSPYLEDSDSDGFSDKEEISSGNNPSCPVGSDCQATEVFSESEINNSDIPTEDIQAQLQKAQADALRQIMLDTGFEKDKLDLISDADLIRLYQENAAEDGQTETSTEKMDAKTIRQEMLDAGFDKSKLDLISDADLVKAYEDSLAAYNAKQTNQ